MVKMAKNLIGRNRPVS